MKNLLAEFTTDSSLQKKELANFRVGQLRLPSLRNRKKNEDQGIRSLGAVEHQPPYQHMHNGRCRAEERNGGAETILEEIHFKLNKGFLSMPRPLSTLLRTQSK